MGAAGVLFQRDQAQPVAAATGATADFDTANVVYASLDINLQAINAGTVVFTLQRLGADGVWYGGPATAALAAPGAVSIDLSPGAARVAGQSDHFVFTNRARIAYTLAGGANAVSWSASLMGRAGA